MISKYRWFVILCAIGAISGLCAGAEKTEHVWKDGKWVVAPTPAEGTPEGELALVRRHLDNDRPKDALKAAKKFMAGYPNDERREEVMMLIGQAEMDRGNYDKACNRFNEQMDQYRNGDFYDRAVQRQYLIADAFLKGRKRRAMWMFKVSAVDRGIEILNGIADRVPGTVVAEKALIRVADYHYDAGQVVQAVEAYDHYMKTFPQSPRKRMSHAMLRAARARYAQYKGEAFDDTPLTDAQQRFMIFADRYTEESNKANVPMVLSQIRNALVRRYFASAKFYKRVGRKKAAIFYYRKVIDQNADSHWAKRAADALKELGAGPAPRKKADDKTKTDAKTSTDSKSPKNGKVEK
ncbi:MAG: outer membrane protein assembly factor BamD [Phycisphaerae bacterium]|jgi:outer membrane protein assembly factor BamD (BamD/ComL family)|nr:outer membrane protein assembly factor BamD [Phycisphaerae bacterium]